MSGRERAAGAGGGDGLDAEREVALEDERSADDADLGWGEGRGTHGEDERFLRDVPPHWG